MRRRERGLTPVTTRPGYVVVEAVDDAEGGLLLYVGGSRVEGRSRTSIASSNLRHRWNVRAGDLVAAGMADDVAAGMAGDAVPARSAEQDARVLGISSSLALVWHYSHNGALVQDVASALELTLDAARRAGVPRNTVTDLRRAGVR